ncbi:protein CBFA2T3 [Neophocaena asiaeorientalis asiaeorientalis]|uniref:Protein CBFA2T3 n=1 Tax=Neophocaena asiaeorientalis asiaeorientalis TaxID=1706337 RepID=A0A341AQM2_NEOAA|nr:protein CBFA2T3 [Neophocaena asiaeorientalis asiaeorientalis]
MSRVSPVLESGLTAPTSCSAPKGPRKGGPADRKEKASAMPGSPAEVKTQPQATPPSMPPPPPAASQGATRHPPFTPHTNREDGPAMSLPHGRFHGCLKWSMVCLLMNGSSPSPTAVSGTPSTPSGFSNGPATSCTAALSTQQLPPACGARQLSKLKRFLATLQQFGSDISPEIGERVRTLVLGLVNSTLTIEEFHSKLQEATNFPLRPFVIPFLKASLPLLQRELLHCARLAKQTPAQYLAQHEQLLLDASASSPSDSSELLPEVNENGKRRTPDRTKENGSDRDPLHPDHLSKRPCTLSPAQRCSPSNGLPQPTPPPHYRLEDMAVAHHFRDSYRHLDPRELRERHRQLGERRAAGVHACAKWRWGRAEHPGLPCARERWRCPGRMGTEDVGAEERFAPHPAWAAPRSLRDSHLSRGGATGCRHLRARRAPPHGRWAPWLQRCLSWGLRRARPHLEGCRESPSPGSGQASPPVWCPGRPPPQPHPAAPVSLRAVEVGFQAAALSPLGKAWRAGWPGPECGAVSRLSSSSSGSPGPACPQLLTCIMDMAEKTRRSLTVLRRCQEADREELNHWIRRHSDAAQDSKKGPAPAARPLGSSAGAEGSQLDVHRESVPRTLSSYVPEEIWRKAEEAVNEVKRQAMSELQKAVSDAERKAHELISMERAKMERALAEARRQASEDALTVVNQQEDSSESCWNCGRKASETCSGCNAARYCGSFCQHKDWEKHHHVCGQSLQGPSAAAVEPVPGQPDATPGLGPCLPPAAACPNARPDLGADLGSHCCYCFSPKENTEPTRLHQCNFLSYLMTITPQPLVHPEKPPDEL